MQLRYVFSETGTGLRRNLSMSIALVVTIFVSLTLVGFGALLQLQAQKAEQYWGSKLKITVFLCNANATSPHCSSGEVNNAQKRAIREVLDNHPEVDSYSFESKADAFAAWKKVYVTNDKAKKTIYSVVTVDDMEESYRVTLKDPQNYAGVESALRGMDGVDSVRDLRDVLDPIYSALGFLKWGAIGIAVFLLVAAILQVANTLRLAAFARRKEIGIMRLVGASTLYISLPFLLETLVAAVVGVALAAGALGLFVQLLIYDKLRLNLQIVEWVDWHDTLLAVGFMAAVGVVITVVPTLVLTRKYLKV